MRILLTNDDGIRAPGIIALHDALIGVDPTFNKPLGSVVYPIAPLTVQSATSHGVTFHTPLMVREERMHDRMEGVAVDGRPADCVKLAITNLWPEKFGRGSMPDVVISGMNAGANVGINVIYSGTVAAALEAAFLGIPSIAVSLHLGRGKPNFELAARHARRAIEAIIAKGLPDRHACLSVNIPVTEIGMDAAQTKQYPIRVCRMNTHGLNDKYQRRVAPGGEVYYWAAGNGLDFRNTDEGSDVQEIFQRAITVTPLRYDLTKKSVLGGWAERLEGAVSAV
ncbi:MAG: 5'/3'-nucleotidase SurE [Phycisphaerales bacterium]|nr:5'/3'-nucleotidase SurE [Phycisphaerales bacterium]